ncbi:NTE family protein [Geosporobacter subterraneus DSM 17957]|uniref:NTE family protein n=1 Tax=Geosporobacter subterraneus DSM 17957 TaxID=1121919 RepID=A0A1M6LP57_9FIRM|nr:patatin-like phospholipase family protein [Geosporobacter subterraneus]SHJ72862.1 NTE family protein [Geosporobacter subterraneus DSM 17957]
MPKPKPLSLISHIKDTSLFRKKNTKELKIGLALSGGAVWGISHIGVLKAFEDNHIPISFIGGTSIGALIGALYAAGMTVAELENLALNTQWKDISKLSLLFRGLLSNEPMEQYIENLVGNLTFDDLKIPFQAVAADLITGEEVILKSGRLSAALRATTAIPGIYQPVQIENRTLVDGGIVNNVPIQMVRDMGADLVVGVSLSSVLNNWIPKNSLEVILKCYSIMQQKCISREMVHADIPIHIDMTNCSPIDFSCAKTSYNRGLIAGLMAVDQIQAKRKDG